MAVMLYCQRQFKSCKMLMGWSELVMKCIAVLWEVITLVKVGTAINIG